MGEDELCELREAFASVRADGDRTPAEHAAADHLLEAIDYSLRGDMPTIADTMRAAGLAIAAIPRSESE